jgi:itaconate CoA-transferase
MVRDVAAEYRSRLMSADIAVADIASGAQVAMAMAIGQPPALLAALAARVEAGALADLDLWYFHSMPQAAETILRYELLDRVRPHCMFMTGIERALIARGAAEGREVVDFTPCAFSESPRLLTERIELDAFVVTVSPMDRHGWFTFGTNNDYASVAARATRRLIVEVNPNMPRVFGESLLHVSEVDAIVEHETSLAELTPRPASPEDENIAATIAGLIGDGACLQMGIGALPNAVCAKLKDHRDLGIHTELMTPGLAALIECGAVTNQRKTTYRGRSVFTFAMGDRAFYDLLDDNPSMHSAPVHIVNDPRHIAKNDNVVSVNATIQVDLTGACNSEHVAGRQYSGSGGQLDFVRGAAASKGGKSIIACHSTAKGGTVSRIVPALEGPVTTPRNDTHIIATEYGIADLKGKSLRQRAEALIAIAHPKFRKELVGALG